MKVSIIIPVYNVEEYIADCLNSVINQTYKGDLECILVDDCTPDNSCSIIKNILSNYKGNIEFKLIQHKLNKGLSGARNTGINYATGDYLYFLDSDDEIFPETIGLLVNKIRESQTQMCVGSYSIKYEIKTTFKDRHYPNAVLHTPDTIISALLKYEWDVMAWNKLINRHFIIENKLYFEERLIHEDVYWTFKMLACLESVSVISDFTYIYRQREGSIMNSDERQAREATYDILKKMSDDLLNEFNLSQYKMFQDKYNIVILYICSLKSSMKENYYWYKKMAEIKLQPSLSGYISKTLKVSRYAVKLNNWFGFFISYVVVSLMKRIDKYHK